MNTYYLGREEVTGYLVDFLDRLAKAETMPTVWCPVTDSGEALVEALVKIVADRHPTLLPAIAVVSIDVVNGTNEIIFHDPTAKQTIEGKSVLLLDGAIHSGRMMSQCADKLLEFNPSELTSYSLVIKRCSRFIPTVWGVMIDETDRAYFLLDSLPNNRLDVGQRPLPPVQLRLLTKEHVSKPTITCSVSSIDRMNWSDRLFQMESSDGAYATYVLERSGKIVGFLTIHPIENDGLAIDEIVIDPNEQSHGYGGILLRFADNMARQSDCHLVRLNAIKGKVSLYEKFGYEPCAGKSSLFLDEEEYVPMHRKVLYHQRAPRQ